MTKKKTLIEELGISPERLPRHIAIIMDGNGRWAQKRRLSRIQGHQHAVKAVTETIETCGRLGIEYLTLYAFSLENWSRPKKEINALMRLLKRFIISERHSLIKNDIRLDVIGRPAMLPEDIRRELQQSIRITRKNKALRLIVALNYGSRDEIAQAAQKCAAAVLKGKMKLSEITEQTFPDFLYTTGIPDPDLLIRTSGEMRMSNFLLWQLSYTEICVTPVLWPDFRKKHIFEAIREYAGRERRYGGVNGIA